MAQLQYRIGVHARRDGEILVLHIDFGLHGPGFEVHITREAHDLSRKRTADRIHANLQLIADMNKLHIVLGHRHAQAQKIALREPHDGKVLVVGVGAALDQCAGVGIAPNHNSIQRRRHVGVVFQRLHALIV